MSKKLVLTDTDIRHLPPGEAGMNGRACYFRTSLGELVGIYKVRKIGTMPRAVARDAVWMGLARVVMVDSSLGLGVSRTYPLGMNGFSPDAVKKEYDENVVDLDQEDK